jgi:hypothetical protein
MPITINEQHLLDLLEECRYSLEPWQPYTSETLIKVEMLLKLFGRRVPEREYDEDGSRIHAE